MPRGNLGASVLPLGPFAPGIDYLYKIAAGVGKAACEL